VLDASGNGVVAFAPRGTRWHLDFVSVKCTTRVKEATVRIYEGYVGDQYYTDGTFSGSSGDTSNTEHYMEDGETIHIVWTGGDPGARATAIIRGWESVQGGGFRAVQ
jgi:hypothetical protein